MTVTGVRPRRTPPGRAPRLRARARAPAGDTWGTREDSWGSWTGEEGGRARRQAQAAPIRRDWKPVRSRRRWGLATGHWRFCRAVIRSVTQQFRDVAWMTTDNGEVEKLADEH